MGADRGLMIVCVVRVVGVNIYKCNNPGHVALTYDDGPYKYVYAHISHSIILIPHCSS